MFRIGDPVLGNGFGGHIIMIAASNYTVVLPCGIVVVTDTVIHKLDTFAQHFSNED